MTPIQALQSNPFAEITKQQFVDALKNLNGQKFTIFAYTNFPYQEVYISEDGKNVFGLIYTQKPATIVKMY